MRKRPNARFQHEFSDDFSDRCKFYRTELIFIALNPLEAIYAATLWRCRPHPGKFKKKLPNFEKLPRGRLPGVRWNSQPR